MIVVLDASTLINLVNGEVLAAALSLPGHDFQVSGVVRQESKTVAAALEAAVDSGALAWVDDSMISANQFSEAKADWQLDDGETECILAGHALGCVVASDDLAARKVVISKLGGGRLLGSIGLLRLAILEELLEPEEAFAAYKLMVARGGFLPEFDRADFNPPF
ncbi:MAG: hypothetical protein J0I65_06650 [Variovorax sp.]|nr:hypothetical protein [Variovorax sp.]